MIKPQKERVRCQSITSTWTNYYPGGLVDFEIHGGSSDNEHELFGISKQGGELSLRGEQKSILSVYSLDRKAV